MCKGELRGMIHMAYVTAADEDSAPTVLIVDNNPMSTRRLTEVFRVKEFHVVVCEDGDQAVDEYIRLDPELVVIALDIPTLDGHLAALEMREHGGEGRIVFITPRRLADLARDASHSAGPLLGLRNQSHPPLWMKSGNRFSDKSQKHPDSKTSTNSTQKIESNLSRMRGLCLCPHCRECRHSLSLFLKHCPLQILKCRVKFLYQPLRSPQKGQQKEKVLRNGFYWFW